MKFTLTFEGGDQLAKALQALPDELSKKVQLDALKVAAEPIRADASSRAPHEPGAPDLKDNIGISPMLPRMLSETEQGVRVGPTKDFYYGMFQEFGTIHHPAQPFLRPAFDGGAQQALTILGDELWWALRQGIPTSQQTFAA